MDLYLFQQINQFALKWLWLDVLGIFFAEYLGYILIFCLFLPVLYHTCCGPRLSVLKFKRYWLMVLQAFVSAAFARFAIVGLIRWFWQRPRPFVENNVNLLLTHNSAAFPSGHAAFFFAFSIIVYFYNKKAGILFLISSFLICLARVFVGIHWPLDILAGAVVGIFSGWLIYKISKRFR